MCNTPAQRQMPRPHPIAIVVTEVTCGHYWICAKNTKQMQKTNRKTITNYSNNTH